MGVRYIVRRVWVAAMVICLGASTAWALTASENYARGNTHFAAQEYDKAIAAYGEAIRLNPRHETAYNNRGVAYEKKGDTKKAIENYSKALEINPRYPRAFYNRANVYYGQKKLELAIKDYTGAIENEDKNIQDNFDKIEAIQMRGLLYKEDGKNDPAIADYNEVIRRDPSRVEAFDNRGELYALKGATGGTANDLKQALADFSQAIRLKPDYAPAYVNRAALYRERKEYQLALKDFDEAIRLRPYLGVYNDRGLTHEAMGRLDLAVADFSQAIAINPTFYLPIGNRARAYDKQGNYALALADYNKAVETSEGAQFAYYSAINRRGEYYKKRGSVDLALKDFNKVIENDPNESIFRAMTPWFGMAYYNRGNIYMERNDLRKAISDYTAAIECRSIEESFFVARARAFVRLSERDNASSDLDEALKLKPELEKDRDFQGLRAEVQALAVAASVASSPAPAVSAAVRPPERRVALVIGNSRYAIGGRLENPVRDAEAVAQSLRSVGFDNVQMKSELGYDDLRRALRDFSAQAEQADWAVVYYAGHGIEVGGLNYLVPTDASLKSDRDVQFEAVSLDQVLGSVEGAHKLRIVILDACRDNPFAPQMKRAFASRSTGRGLARVEPEQGGTLIAYAAKTGTVASDGSAGYRNSPFAGALTRNIYKPGLEINKLFRVVRDEVMAETARKQEPYVSGSLGAEDFFFKAP